VARARQDHRHHRREHPAELHRRRCQRAISDPAGLGEHADIHGWATQRPTAQR
jgi:hypothetical protein